MISFNDLLLAALSCSASFVALFYAWRKKVFQLPPNSLQIQIERVTGGSFAFVIICCFLITNFLSWLLTLFLVPTVDILITTPSTIYFVSLSVVALLHIVTKFKKIPFFSSRASVKTDFIKACGMYLVGMPVLWAIYTCSSLIFDYYSISHEQKQMIIDYIKSMRHQPLLCALLIFDVSFIAPIAEEWFFRGFLHTYLRKYLRPSIASVISSFLFAALHFEYAMSWSNLPLLLSLFFFSILLTLLYEKQNSLRPSMLLHVLANAMTCAYIVLCER